MTLVDFKVLLGVLTADPAWKAWSLEQLRRAIVEGGERRSR